MSGGHLCEAEAPTERSETSALGVPTGETRGAPREAATEVGRTKRKTARSGRDLLIFGYVRDIIEGVIEMKNVSRETFLKRVWE